MKFSTPLTLAAITLMSTTGSTNARIGQHTCQNPATYISEIAQCTNAGNGYTCQNVRLGGTPVYRCVAPAPTSAPIDPLSCTDPSNYNPTFTPQCQNVGSGYTCMNVRLGGPHPEYRCVAPPSTPAPTAAPTPAAPVSCQDPSTYNKTFTPQCINVGSGGYTCKNVRLGGDALYQCVPPPPTAAPTSQETIPCHTNHNPTTTPECPSGYTCEALMGANPNTYDGQCIEDIYD